MKAKGSRGFTLIELMIAVAIVALLAAVAYPSYQNAMIKGRRAAAQTALADVAQRQQQFLLDNRAYAGTTAALKLTLPSDVTSYYDVVIDVPATTPPTFTATATPKGSQTSDGPLTINNAGVKTPAGKW